VSALTQSAKAREVLAVEKHKMAAVSSSGDGDMAVLAIPTKSRGSTIFLCFPESGGLADGVSGVTLK